jgi:hypothetical protein
MIEGEEGGVTIDLKPEQERILHDALSQGRFRSLEEALDQAIRSIADVHQDSPPLTPKAAAEHIRELRKGNVLPAGVTIRDLIDEGRA